MWRHEASIEIAAAPARIWQLFADVPGWKRWNAGIASIELHGPFAEGTSFTMQPPGMDAFTSTLIEVQENRLFTDQTMLDEVTVVVSHRIEPLDAARSRVSYVSVVTGPEAAEIGAAVTADFGDVLAALKQLAEA
ncbi:SRPBCC family protein [Dyella sp. LX-66]|uniref:SRPBCC family protein n=1 Tax=unclassified Dyella TaxID=2634549 RepID=UPI001BE07EB9|nr:MULTISPECIES: SRPBCC family protein [unclassified Dyella]MBT2115485.1 SRPBCC family protein [Dyella sp. LX-1]MBT2139300.1 SRPBCC family protein [Dyella sp. LX-66]